MPLNSPFAIGVVVGATTTAATLSGVTPDQFQNALASPFSSSTVVGSSADAQVPAYTCNIQNITQKYRFAVTGTTGMDSSTLLSCYEFIPGSIVRHVSDLVKMLKSSESMGLFHQVAQDPGAISLTSSMAVGVNYPCHGNNCSDWYDKQNNGGDGEAIYGGTHRHLD